MCSRARLCWSPMRVKRCCAPAMQPGFRQMRGTDIVCKTAPIRTRSCSRSARARPGPSAITPASTWSRRPAANPPPTRIATARLTKTSAAAALELGSPAQGVSGAARVGAGFERAALLVDQDPADGPGEPDPVGPALDLMAAARELGADFLREPALDIEPAGVVVVRRKG